MTRKSKIVKEERDTSKSLIADCLIASTDYTQLNRMGGGKKKKRMKE